jgi:hypothetical protein
LSCLLSKLASGPHLVFPEVVDSRILEEVMHKVFYRTKTRVYNDLHAWIARYR